MLIYVDFKTRIDLKKFLLFTVGCLICSVASAQFNYYRLSLGLGAGTTQAYADVNKVVQKPTLIGSVDYNLTPFSSVGLEVQKGSISGGDKVLDPHLRYFNNSYMAIILGGKVQLGQFVDFESSGVLNALKGFYIGTGIGMVKNKMADIVRQKPDLSNPENPGVYVFPGMDSSTDLMLPINTGISFAIMDQWRFTKYIFGINYQFNPMFGEGIDGYNDPPAKFRNGRDYYGVASFSIKYCFGPEGLY